MFVRIEGMTTYIALVLAGAFLMVLEVFLPGGVLGMLGVVALLAASYVAVATYGGVAGYLLAAAAILLGCLMVYLVVRIFPNTFVGKKLSLPTDMKESRADDIGLVELVGAEGVAATILRPAGFADIGGKRVDVVTRGENIEQGAKVRVVEVEGNRVVVEKI